MSLAVRDARTIEWTVVVTNAKRAVKETQQDHALCSSQRGCLKR